MRSVLETLMNWRNVILLNSVSTSVLAWVMCNSVIWSVNFHLDVGSLIFKYKVQSSKLKCKVAWCLKWHCEAWTLNFQSEVWSWSVNFNVEALSFKLTRSWCDPWRDECTHVEPISWESWNSPNLSITFGVTPCDIWYYGTSGQQTPILGRFR